MKENNRHPNQERTTQMRKKKKRSEKLRWKEKHKRKENKGKRLITREVKKMQTEK